MNQFDLCGEILVDIKTGKKEHLIVLTCPVMKGHTDDHSITLEWRGVTITITKKQEEIS